MGTSRHFRRPRAQRSVSRALAGLLSSVLLGQVVSAAEPPGQPLLVLDSGGHTAIVSQVCFTPDGRNLVSVSHDKTIRIWDVATGDTLRVLRPPIAPGVEGMLYAGAVSPDGRLLAAAGLVASGGAQPNVRPPSNIYLISLDAGRIERVLTGHTDAVYALAFSRDGRLLASAGTDTSARVWDVGTGQCRHVLRGHGEAISDVAFSPDVRSLATASHDDRVRIWSLDGGQTTAVLAGHREDVGAVDWSPDGRTLATGSDDGSIRLWAPDGRLQKSFSDRGGGVQSVAFSADGRRLLYTVASDRARTGGYLIDLDTGRLRSKYTGYDTSVYDGALSPDGALAATTGGSGNEISLWTTAGGTLVGRLVGGGRTVVSCGWGGDGKTIVWGNTLGATSYNDYGPLERAFRLDSLAPTRLPAGPFYRARSAGDGRSLEKAGDHVIVAREQGQAATRLELDPRDRVLSSTLLPGRRAAVGSSHGLFLFDLRSAKALGEFKGHTGQVLAVALSRDEKYLLSASTDQTLRVWDPRYSAPLLSIFFVGSEWVAWTRQGYYAASPGGERLMGWQVNQGWDQMASFHPAVRFRKTLYRPDVIQRLLEAGNVEEALLAAGRESGRTEDPTSVAQVLPPDVRVTAPQGPKVDVSQPQIEVRAVATPQGKEPVVAMRLLLDGRPYQGRLGQRTIVRGRARAEAVEQTWTLELTPGVHQVAVKAETSASYAVSPPLEITFGADSVDLPALYVLAIGLSDHQDPRQRLEFGAKDARALAAVVNKTSPPVFRDVQVRVLADSEATRRAILQGLDWLNEQMTPHDVAVFSFSGHGVRDRQGELFLFPFDGEPEEVSISGVSEEAVKRYCQSTPGRLLLLLDACHSGAIGGDFRAGEAAVADDLVRDLLTEDYGVIVMCSSMGREVSLENPDWGHGAFTLALTEGLEGGADYNGDGVIHLNEIDLYVADRVEKLTDGAQHPVTQKPTTIRSFPLAKP